MFLLKEYEYAKKETKFSYKNCCIDERGIFFSETYKLKKEIIGLSSLNSSKLEAKTCSQRNCFYSENLFQSIWILSQVN